MYLKQSVVSLSAASAHGQLANVLDAKGPEVVAVSNQIIHLLKRIHIYLLAWCFNMKSCLTLYYVLVVWLAKNNFQMLYVNIIFDSIHFFCIYFHSNRTQNTGGPVSS